MKKIALVFGLIGSLLALNVALVIAKEIGSGGGTGIVTTTCNPVKGITTKGDARAGETGLATIDVSYSVSPCDKTIPYTVSVVVKENIINSTTPVETVYEDLAAADSAKFTIFGVKVRTSYSIKVTVTNAITGEVLGSSTAFAAAIPKGV